MLVLTEFVAVRAERCGPETVRRWVKRWRS
jgi:hypothetical protein